MLNERPIPYPLLCKPIIGLASEPRPASARHAGDNKHYGIEVFRHRFVPHLRLEPSFLRFLTC